MSTRILIFFSKLDGMRFTSHLDLHHTWERTFRRANLPVIYSKGFNPRPRINIASALPLGFTGENEVIDVRFDHPVSLMEIGKDLNKALPPGLSINEIRAIDPHSRSLQSQVIAGDYVITFLDPFPDLKAKVKNLLDAEEIPRERRGKAYDLRPLIESLEILPRNEQDLQRISVTLTAIEGATGRPEEVIDALGYDPLGARVHRVRIIFKQQLDYE